MGREHVITAQLVTMMKTSVIRCRGKRDLVVVAVSQRVDPHQVRIQQYLDQGSASLTPELWEINLSCC